MELGELLDKLGYAESPNYLRQESGDFDRVVDYGHLLRRAARDPCRLRGAYALVASPTASIPLVYVCEAESEAAAKEVHRLVWNQDAAPFLVVNTPETVRVYPGFCHKLGNRRERAVETVLDAFGAADLDRITQTLHANVVDSGQTWRSWGRYIRPEHRVDWRLLDNLKQLDAWLQRDGELGRDSSHALIGKYVYLHYLRDREILSDRKLEKWRIPAHVVFGRNATVDGLQAVIERLDDWLNGEVFPIDFSRPGAPRDEHVSRVAGTFKGDQPLGGGQWQLYLDFKAYDFSYVPIEVLSVIYQQFLHAATGKGGKSRGRSKGAYYTPIPVVNFMLSELEEHRPLRRGMRVFDPACGSGAFLVQAFRRLIEKEFPPGGPDPSLVDLRELLKDHFFGLDTDPDACSVAELSLILTLLDYVRPPDLENGKPGPKPKLPKLRQENIFRGNFFDDGADWQRSVARRGFDWVVGNPPWKQLKSGQVDEEDEQVLRWILENEKSRPVGNRQEARAFVWRVAEYVGDDGEIAMFLPAISLFESAAKGFRAGFFRQMHVHSVANFSNLAEVISAGRFRVPAAAFFYRPRTTEEGPAEDECIRTYCPLVANQEATRPVEQGRRNESWSIVVNASEITDVPWSRVAGGDGLAWKLATWGSDLDARLLRGLQRRFGSIGQIEKSGLLFMSEGPQLRAPHAREDIEFASGIDCARTIDLSKLERLRHFFAFPPEAVVPLGRSLTHVRKGRWERPLAVCRPPHVVVSASRNFAVYSEDFLIVPPRQIGIASPSGDKDLLKALSLLLNSDFAFYHQFFASPQFGVKRPVATLGALREMPAPLAEFSKDTLRSWAKLQDVLLKATQDAFVEGQLLVDAAAPPRTQLRRVLDRRLMDELNDRVYKALGLDGAGRALVHDLVCVRLELDDGKVGREAVRQPTAAELRSYGNRLQSELDSFVDGVLAKRHRVEIIFDDASGMVRVALTSAQGRRHRTCVLPAGAREARALETCRKRLRRQRSQWVYFDRNLRAYEGARTYILKPMQRFHWTQTQARIDAREIIAESMVREGQLEG